MGESFRVLLILAEDLTRLFAQLPSGWLALFPLPILLEYKIFDSLNDFLVDCALLPISAMNTHYSSPQNVPSMRI